MADDAARRRIDKRWYSAIPAAREGGSPRSAAVRAGDLLFLTCQGDALSDGRIVVDGDVRTQARRMFDNVESLLRQAGGTLEDVVDVVSFHRDVRDVGTVLGIAQDVFGDASRAWTPTAFLGGHDPRIEVSMRAIAHLGSESKECVTPDRLAWMRELPMSGGCMKGGLLFVSGQTAGDDVPPGLDHVAQARAAYAAMLEVVTLAGGTVDDILDFASFHHDIRGAHATFDEVYVPAVLGRADLIDAPTTSHIGSPALIPPGVLGSYRCLADLRSGRRVGSLPDSIWWKGVLPISGAARKDGGHIIAVAGHVASDESAQIVASGDVAGQVRYILDSMGESLEGLGASLEDVVEITSYYKEPRAWRTILDVGSKYFPNRRGPAWTLAAMPGLWVEGFLAEISAVAVV